MYYHQECNNSYHNILLWNSFYHHARTSKVFHLLFIKIYISTKNRVCYVFSIGKQWNMWLRSSKCDNMYLRNIYIAFITKTMQLLIKDKCFLKNGKIVLANAFDCFFSFKKGDWQLFLPYKCRSITNYDLGLFSCNSLFCPQLEKYWY